MELRQLRYFVTIADTHSLTKAAQQLYISQPALTENIKNLEQELNTRLFTRSRKGMELTNAGSTFLDYAKSLLNQANRAVEIVNQAESEPRGEVSLAMPASISHTLSVNLFTYINERYPGITLRLEEFFTSSMDYVFDSSSFDFIVTFDVKKNINTNVELLYKEKLFLITQFNEKRNRKTIDFKELANYPLMMPRLRHGLLPKVGILAEEYGIELDILPSIAPLYIMLRLTEAGKANAVLPWRVIRELVESKKISAYEIVNPVIKRSINLISPSDRPVSHATEVVIATLKEVVNESRQGDALGR
jgi:LysR family nitrogen assimilation transcriptional regulator